MHAILTPVNWRNVAESFWSIVVHCIRCGRFTDRCGTLRCLMVHCGTVRKHCRRVADHRSALRCDVYVVEGLQTVKVPCGGLQCIAVHCGNVAEGLQTIAVHCGVVCTLWKAYEPLWYLPVPYATMRALQCTEEMLQKACG